MKHCLSSTRCFWGVEKRLPTSDHFNLTTDYNVIVRFEKNLQSHYFLEELKMANKKETIKTTEKKTNQNGITELVFILDRSGSMSGLEKDTIGGFNSMIEKQKKQDGSCYVSTVLFDDESEVLHDRVKLGDIPKMTDNDYTVRGCTALIDAIGEAIHHIGNIHKYARPEDVPEHTMFVITTDGMENASHKYSSERIKKMIKKQEEKYGWQFIFVAANIDAVETAENIGIRKERAANYDYSEMGTRNLYQAVGCAVTSMRNREEYNESWKDELDS